MEKAPTLQFASSVPRFSTPRQDVSSRIHGAPYKKHGATVTETENSRQERSPVVVLLGWNGSKDKHLAKYSEIFTQRNYATVSVTANPFDTFFRSGTKVKQISHNILDILTEMNCEDRPVFLYAFSNGGAAVYFHMMEELTMPQSKYNGKVKVVGSIFDSCPIDTDIKNVGIVQKSVTDPIRNPVVKALVWYMLLLFTSLVVYLNPTVKRFMMDLKASPLLCNQLMLYSKADHLAPYLEVEDYIDARRKLGVRVVAQCWEDSSHVNHYREHKHEYVKTLNNFVDECLAGNIYFSSKL